MQSLDLVLESPIDGVGWATFSAEHSLCVACDFYITLLWASYYHPFEGNVT